MLKCIFELNVKSISSLEKQKHFFLADNEKNVAMCVSLLCFDMQKVFQEHNLACSNYMSSMYMPFCFLHFIKFYCHMHLSWPIFLLYILLLYCVYL